MSGSALIGHPPNNPTDALIITGYWKYLHKDKRPTDRTSIIPTRIPPNAPHESLQTYNIAWCVIVIILTTTITGTRLFLRIHHRDLKWGLDDWAILIAQLGVVAYFTMQVVISVQGGAGKHSWDITYSEYNVFHSLSLASQVVYYPVLGVIKISIALFNRRFTGITSRPWKIFHNAFLAVLVVFIIASIFCFTFTQVPPIAGYDLIKLAQMDGSQKMIMDSRNVSVAYSAVHIATDIILLGIPMYLISRLQMPIYKKLRLGVLFAVGLVSCIGSVMRQVTLKGHSHDLTYVYVTAILKWNIVDIFFAITVASLPTLNVLFLPAQRSLAKWLGHPISSTRRSFPTTASKNNRQGELDTQMLTATELPHLSVPSSRNLSGDEEEGISRQGSSAAVKYPKGVEWATYSQQIRTT